MPKKIKQKRTLFYLLAVVLFIISGTLFGTVVNQNHHINHWLVVTRLNTHYKQRKQAKDLIKLQSQQGVLANYHEMYNSYYLEQHPKIKNYRQLAKDTHYMNQSQIDTSLNNTITNKISNINYKNGVEKQDLKYEFAHSTYGNIENGLDTPHFDKLQDNLKTKVTNTFLVFIIAFAFFVYGVTTKSRYLKDQTKMVESKKQKRLVKEYGDSQIE